MTIGVNNRNDATGNGTTATYPYGFKIFAGSDLEVTVRNTTTDVETTLTYLTHYTVTGVATPAGGNVVLTDGAFAWLDANNFLDSDYTISIRRKVVLSQTTDIRNQGRAYAPSVHEDAFDYLTMIDQQQQDELDRALRVGASFPDIDTLLPAPVAGTLLGWAADELSIENKISAGLLSVSAYGESLLNAADAAAARTLLVTPSNSEALLDTIFDAKGDLLIATAADTPARLPIGTNGFMLMPHSAAAEGMIWSSPGPTLFTGRVTVTPNSPANGITLAIKARSGNDPSNAEPVYVAIPDGAGSYDIFNIVSAMSLAITSGSTLGTVSGQAHRIYFGFANDNGTLRLFVYQPIAYTSADEFTHATIVDGQTYTSTAEGGAGGADLAQTLYTATAMGTPRRVRVVGYWEGSQATAGTWVSAVTLVHVLKPGDRRSGDVVQTHWYRSGALQQTSSAIPYDDTIPQNAEGAEWANRNITPSAAPNIIQIEAALILEAASIVNMALFKNTDADAKAVVHAREVDASSTVGATLPLFHQEVANTTSATAWKIRFGKDTAANCSVNGDGANRRFGGAANSRMVMREIFA